jgi:hypothetical protein
MRDEGCYRGATVPLFEWDYQVLLTDGRAAPTLRERQE